MNSIEIKNRKTNWENKLFNARINQDSELIESITEKINILKAYAQSKNIYTGEGSLWASN
jgi:hypothetical protein